MTWSENDRNIAFEAWNAGMSAAEVSRLKTFEKPHSRCAVLGIVHRAWQSGDPRLIRPCKPQWQSRRIWNDEDDLLMLAMAEPRGGEEMWTDEEIAAYFRVTPEEVHRRRKMILKELEASDAA